MYKGITGSYEVVRMCVESWEDLHGGWSGKASMRLMMLKVLEFQNVEEKTGESRWLISAIM